jgi:hypothetical protein
MRTANIVSRASVGFVGAVEHDGRDHGHFDRRGRDGEDEGAEGFSEPLREAVGVANDGERAPEHDGENPCEGDSAADAPVLGRREMVTEAPQDRGGGESGQDGRLAAQDGCRGGQRSHSGHVAHQRMPVLVWHPDVADQRIRTRDFDWAAYHRTGGTAVVLRNEGGSDPWRTRTSGMTTTLSFA